MPLSIINGYNIICETCGTSAPPAFDQATAISNAIAAGFIEFTVPDNTPKAGQSVWIDSICLSGAANSAAVALAAADGYTTDGYLYIWNSTIGYIKL